MFTREWVRSKLTEDAWDGNGLDVLRAGLVGVSRNVGNVETESRVVAQVSVQIWK